MRRRNEERGEEEAGERQRLGKGGLGFGFGVRASVGRFLLCSVFLSFFFSWGVRQRFENRIGT